MWHSVSYLLWNTQSAMSVKTTHSITMKRSNSPKIKTDPTSNTLKKSRKIIYSKKTQFQYSYILHPPTSGYQGHTHNFLNQYIIRTSNYLSWQNLWHETLLLKTQLTSAQTHSVTTPTLLGGVKIISVNPQTIPFWEGHWNSGGGSVAVSLKLCGWQLGIFHIKSDSHFITQTLLSLV